MNRRTVRKSVIVVSGVAFVTVITLASALTRVSAGDHRHAVTVPCTAACPPPPPTELSTGPDSDDLKVHVVGPYFDSIEVYFKTEYFHRETFPKTSYLQYNNRISLAKKNKFGTFAVLIGDGTTVRAYGWRASQNVWKTVDLPVNPQCGVVMEWVTDRILKLKYGPGLAHETIVRYDDVDDDQQPWKPLFSN